MRELICANVLTLTDKTQGSATPCARDRSREAEERREHDHDRRGPKREYRQVARLPALEPVEPTAPAQELQREPGRPGQVHEEGEVEAERGRPVGSEPDVADPSDHR